VNLDENKLRLPTRPLTPLPPRQSRKLMEHLQVCLGAYVGPRGVAVSYKRGTPVLRRLTPLPPGQSRKLMEHLQVTKPPKVNLPHTIGLRALCGANLVT
jgi:hypothetical protein